MERQLQCALQMSLGMCASTSKSATVKDHMSEDCRHKDSVEEKMDEAATESEAPSNAAEVRMKREGFLKKFEK